MDTTTTTKKLNTKMAEAKAHASRNIIIEKWKKIDRENIVSNTKSKSVNEAIHVLLQAAMQSSLFLAFLTLFY